MAPYNRVTTPHTHFCNLPGVVSASVCAMTPSTPIVVHVIVLTETLATRPVR